MGLNPNIDDSDSGWRADELISIEGATVVSAKPHTDGDTVGHHVEVRPYSMTESDVASVATTQHGDTCIPTEGDTVLVAYRRDSRPVVIAAEYGSNDSIPDFKPGERRIGHPASDSFVQLNEDGSVDVTGDSGNSITLEADGTITLNDGETAPVTDASVETTTDGDGHVTDVSLSVSRASGVFVPE